MSKRRDCDFSLLFPLLGWTALCLFFKHLFFLITINKSSFCSALLSTCEHCSHQDGLKTFLWSTSLIVISSYMRKRWLLFCFAGFCSWTATSAGWYDSDFWVLLWHTAVKTNYFVQQFNLIWVTICSVAPLITHLLPAVGFKCSSPVYFIFI